MHGLGHLIRLRERLVELHLVKLLYQHVLHLLVDMLVGPGVIDLLVICEGDHDFGVREVGGKRHLLDEVENRLLTLDERQLERLRLTAAEYGAAEVHEGRSVLVTLRTRQGLVEQLTRDGPGTSFLFPFVRPSPTLGDLVTYLGQKLLEAATLDILLVERTANNRHAGQTRAPSCPVTIVVEKPLNIMSGIAENNEIDTRLAVDVLGQDLLEDVRGMVLGALAARDGVDGRVVVAALLHGALHRRALAAARVERALALGPPPRLAHVGEHDARRRGVALAARLLLESLHDGRHAALVDATRAADDAVREDAELLVALAEDDYDAGLGLDVLAQENGQVRLGGLGAEGQDDFLQALGLEALVNEQLDGLVEVEALALIVALVAVEEELVEELRVLDGANLIIVVDEVADMEGSVGDDVYRNEGRIIPEFLEIGLEDGVPRESLLQTSEHLGGFFLTGRS